MSPAPVDKRTTSNGRLGLPTQWYSFRRQLVKRAAYVAREARTQSLGVLLISMTLLTIAGLCARTAYTNWRAYSLSVRAHIDATTARSEPRGDLEYPVVVAAVLAPINGRLVDWSLARLSPRESQRADDILDITARTMRSALLLSRSANVAPPKLQDAMAEGLHVAGQRIPSLRDSVGWTRTVLDHFASVLEPPDDYLVVVDSIDKDANSHRAALNGPVSTERSPTRRDVPFATTLQIPSSVPIVSQRHEGAGRTIPQYMPDVVLAAAASKFLEDGIDASERLFGVATNQNSGSARVVQSYFISARGVLRIWPSRDPVRDLPIQRYWPAANYFQTFFSSHDSDPNDYHTPAYIDVGGNGIVRTLCRVVPTLQDDDTTGIFGIIAVDYQLPVEPFLQALALQNTLCTLVQLRIPHGANLEDVGGAVPTRLLAARRPYGRRVDTLNVWKPIEDAELLGRIRTYGQSRSRADERRALGVLGTHGEERQFILPLADDIRGESVFLILTPNAPRPPWAIGISGILAAGATLWAGILIYHRAQDVGRKTGEASMNIFLRNLPIGVIRTSAEGVVVANQAAEWLLGTTLHQMGEYPDKTYEERRIEHLLMDRIVPIMEGGARGPVTQRKEWVAEQRGLARASSYYAVVRHTNAVVQITGAPIVQGPRRPQMLDRFGVLLPVDEDVAIEVRRLIEEAIEDDQRRRGT